tara:strand:- start:12559 stop:13572 length:1014 start_codon:yes stop_codon:yes gene_type:complete
LKRNNKKLPIALTMGDPAGISAEITVKAWSSRSTAKIPAFIFFGSEELLHRRANLIDCKIKTKKIEEAEIDLAEDIFKECIPVFDIPIEKEIVGQYSEQNDQNIMKSILMAYGSIKSGQTSAIVTNPVNKNSLLYDGVKFSGQTELCAHLCQSKNPVMLMMSDALKIVPLTRHIPISAVSQSINKSLLVNTVKVINDDLKEYFNISQPRIVVTGLNPHAGDNGLIGNEEINVIDPVITELQREKFNIHGPASADSLFGASNPDYDIVICMYHDQALIPIKTISNFSAINITLGIDIIRTSPDHGTAYQIAKKAIADPSSLIKSLIIADRMALRNARS